MSQFAFRAGASVTGTTLSVVVPAAIVAGDLLMFYAAWDATKPLSGPAGWQLQSTATNANDPVALDLFTKTAVAGDAGSTVAVTTTSAALTLVLVAYSGSPAFLSSSTSVNTVAGGTTTFTASTAINPNVNNIEVICWGAENAAGTGGSSSGPTPPAAMATREGQIATAYGVSVADLLLSATGPTAAQTATTTTTDYMVAITALIGSLAQPLQGRRANEFAGAKGYRGRGLFTNF